MADDGDDSFVRLHITPLDSELIKAVIPALVLPIARNVSFHTIQTFPEKRYGFVELPREEADKLKKKFHGVTFKGSKMRIEKARPESRIEPDEKLDGEGEDKEKKKLKRQKEKKKKEDKDGEKSTKKRKREVDVLEGVALKDRKVKRGWTEVPTESKKRKKSKKDGDNDKKEEKKSKKRPPSKYTDGEECLLKMKMPANALKNVPASDLAAQKKKKKGGARQVTVHEFEKTTKFPSFLRQAAGGADSKRATEFVEGKGWVDEEGHVVEVVKEKPERSSAKAKTKSVKPTLQPEQDEDSSETSSDGTSSDESSSSSEEEEEEEKEDSDQEMEAAPPPRESLKTSANEDESDSSTSSSSEDESSDESAATPNQKETTPDSAKKATLKNLVIQTVNPETPQAPRVHPLEALYKRPKPVSDDAAHTPAPTSEAEPFSFFGGGGGGDAADLEDGDEAADSVPAMPLTPFTRQDLEWRNVRSAAPTPDTTHPSRMALHMWPLGTPSGGSNGRTQDWDEVGEDAEEEEEDEEAEEGQGGGGGDASSSDFQKWFWENRRDLNRSWMTRRKTAAKEKRYRENKARASKAV